jgi:hypothetical protein
MGSGFAPLGSFFAGLLAAVAGRAGEGGGFASFFSGGRAGGRGASFCAGVEATVRPGAGAGLIGTRFEGAAGLAAGARPASGSGIPQLPQKCESMGSDEPQLRHGSSPGETSLALSMRAPHLLQKLSSSRLGTPQLQQFMAARAYPIHGSR